jgi:nucleoside-diphosphate-sugar epimerase
VKRVLVTGAGGFIGGHLVKYLLDEGSVVVALDRKPRSRWWQYHEGASNQSLALVRNISKNTAVMNVDEVYHLAADMGGIGYITNHLTSCAANIVDTIKLLEACHKGQRVFFSSSACVYRQDLQSGAVRRLDVVEPFETKGSPLRDTTMSLREEDAYPADPEPGYGWEKLYAEQLMAWHREERGIETRIARYHNVGGPMGSWRGGREKAPAAICRKVAQAVQSGYREIDIWGDGDQVRSFMDVNDCVKGTVMIARGDYEQPINLGSDRSVTVNDLVTIVENIAGVKLKRRYQLDKPQGVRGRNSDNTLIRNVFGWAPETKLEEWLEPTYRWIYDQVARAEDGGEDD